MRNRFAELFLIDFSASNLRPLRTSDFVPQDFRLRPLGTSADKTEDRSLAMTNQVLLEALNGKLCSVRLRGNNNMQFFCARLKQGLTVRIVRRQIYING